MYKTTNLRGAWGGSTKDYMAPYRWIILWDVCPNNAGGSVGQCGSRSGWYLPWYDSWAHWLRNGWRQFSLMRWEGDILFSVEASKIFGYARDPGNYRPISLLCCLYKLLEWVILTKISPLLEDHLPLEQAGFRLGRDTVEQALALTSLIEIRYQEKKMTGAVLMDLSAAYDTVWRDGLLLKIARTIKNRCIVKLLSSMTARLKFFVCWVPNRAEYST